MGADANCRITVNGRTQTGKARLETATLSLRASGLRLDIPFAQLKNVAAADGVLMFQAPDARVTLVLGAAAEKWATKILHPPSRLAKIGVKPGFRVSCVGSVDRVFLAELKAAARRVAVGRVVPDSDVIFFGVSRAADLARIQTLKRSLKPDGALWILRPKGHATVTERAVMHAGKAAGLVDVKVVGFSPTHTAEKFVIPVRLRPQPSSSA